MPCLCLPTCFHQHVLNSLEMDYGMSWITILHNIMRTCYGRNRQILCRTCVQERRKEMSGIFYLDVPNTFSRRRCDGLYSCHAVRRNVTTNGLAELPLFWKIWKYVVKSALFKTLWIIVCVQYKAMNHKNSQPGIFSNSKFLV